MSPGNQTAALHPAVWRASQLAHAHTRCIDTGHPLLSAQLPGGGWPTGSMIDLLPQKAGVGELRLLRPALAAVAQRRIVFLQPPHPPQALALAAMGLAPSQLLWIKADKGGDALWAAEQILRSGSVGALLFWHHQVRSDSLRRLHLAAQSGESLFFMLRPIGCAREASPAPLRLSLRPALGGVEIGFVKRRGPQREAPLLLPLPLTGLQRHAPLDRHPSAPAPARRIQPSLVD